MSEPKPWEQARAEPIVTVSMVEGRATEVPKPRINIRQKGAKGERQLATQLNAIVNALLLKHGLPIPAKPVIQRNQNQSAVGGNDLSNTFSLSIEVKRQENLNVEAWWRQCCYAAERNQEFPVLVYRQNNGPWRVVINLWAQLPAGAGDSACRVRGEIKWGEFLEWFRLWVDRKLSNGELPTC